MIKHTIRTRDGLKEVNLNPITAIKANCLECMGFSEAINCTSPKCPLFPFRTGNSGNRKVLTPEAKDKLSKRIKLLREQGKL